MRPSWLEVNAAIVAVLTDLGRSNGSPRPATRPSDPVFVDRLFSERHARAIGGEVSEVRVIAGTVITPMARDVLKSRGIPIRVVSGREAELSKTRHRGEWGFAIESKGGLAEAIRRNLLADWSELGHEPTEAARWVADGEGRGALVVTDQASVAAWRVNRSEGIRAALVTDPSAVSRAIEYLGVNLILVEPIGQSIYRIKQMADRFRQGGAPFVPDALQHEALPEISMRWTR